MLLISLYSKGDVTDFVRRLTGDTEMRKLLAEVFENILQDVGNKMIENKSRNIEKEPLKESNSIL
jgi:hypothetical protein